MKSRAFVKVIVGPVGGGKSTVALMDLFQRAITQEPFDGVRRTKFIILRNTIAQLRATVKPALDTWFVTMTKGTMGQWRLSENVFEARFVLPDKTVVHSEFCLLAADTPDDVRRLLSLECSAAWVEECREIDPDVFAGLQGRVNRFPARIAGGVTYPGVICSTNPPPVGGFWHGLMTKPEKGVEIFMQPPALLDDDTINPHAENLENLAPEYYDNLIAGKTEDWINVYLKNRFGAGDAGRPVYRGTFKKSFHVSDKPLTAVTQGLNPLIVGMDNGLTAAAVVGQQDARGRVNILAEAYVPDGETMGVETFLDRLLIPKLRLKFPTFKNEKILFVLDPACFQRSQLNEATIAQAVQRRGYPVIQASTNDPERRIAAVEGLLTRSIDGGPGFLIDGTECPHFANAMEWGFRYKKSPSGVSDNKVEKNFHSHCFVGDTWVDTPTGRKRIQDIRAGDTVRTHDRDEIVETTMSHVSHALVKLQFDNGATVVCTPDHPFWTDKGFVRADALEYTDLLQSNVSPTCSESTQSKSSTASSTTASQRGTTSPSSTSTGVSTCTVLFGNTTTALLQKVTTCITSMATRLTIAWKTSRRFLGMSMLDNTCWNTTQHRTGLPSHSLLSGLPKKLQKNGTAVTKGANGIAPTLSTPGLGSSELSRFAPTAGVPTWGYSTYASEGSALCPAKEWPEKKAGWTTKPASARSALQISEQTSTQEKSHAVRLVQRSLWSTTGTRVYDLTVANAHTFYANGILVHNCGDAGQYLSLHYNAQILGLGPQKSVKREVVSSGYVYV